MKYKNNNYGVFRDKKGMEDFIQRYIFGVFDNCFVNNKTKQYSYILFCLENL